MTIIEKVAWTIAMSIAGGLALAVGGCSDSGSPAPTSPSPAPPPPAVIAEFTVAELTGSSIPPARDMQFFLPSGAAVAAVAAFDGVLSFQQAAFAAGPSFSSEKSLDPTSDPLLFPGFSVSLVSDGRDLIPEERDIISTWRTSDSYWDVVVGAGRIWREPADGQWDRASLPLTLVSRREGQARNCVATFLFDTTRVSNGYVQCSQEIAPVGPYEPADLHAQSRLTYNSAGVANAAAIVSAYRAREAARLPLRPWSELPVADPDALAATFNTDATPLSVQSFGGLFFNGAIYAQPYRTRRGAYPYPNEMRHGVFSVTKTLGGALSMLYLAQRYGDAIFDARITDYVPGLAGHPGWQGVTFAHALNMVTGTAGDDDGDDLLLLKADSADEAITAIATLPDAPPAPGTTFSYATTHTFVLSYAMQQYVEAREGAGVYYWDLVQENVLDAIGVDQFPMQKTLEPAGADGIPTLGVGAFPTADDAAKIARLFTSEGEHNGVQLLHRGRTREATNKAGWPGYFVESNIRYQHAFIRYSYSSATRGCSFNGSAMNGLGGNYIVLLPSGVIAMRFMDANAQNTAPLVNAAEKVSPSC